MKRMIAALLAVFLTLPALGVSAYASGDDYFSGRVTVAEEPVIDEADCEETAPTSATAPAPAQEAPATPGLVDVTPRPEEPVSGAVTVTDNIEEPTALTVPAAQQPADTAPRPFTPDGTGATVDAAADTDGKEFFTITTPDENTFYLVIDRQRGAENVYLLDAVTVTDLQSLAEASLAPAPVATEPATEPTEPEPTPEPPPEEEKGGGAGMLIMAVLVVVVGGGAGWYFKIYRPKQQGADVGEPDEDDYDPYADDPNAVDGMGWPDDDDPGAEAEPGGDDE